MRVYVDKERCMGHNRCLEVCPECFTVDEAGKSEPKFDRPPQEWEDRVRLAARCCPEMAILIIDE
jgi:ferredoxin